MGLTMVMNKQQNIGVIIGWALGAIAIVWAIYIIISLIIDYNKDKKKVEELVQEKRPNNTAQKNMFPQGANVNMGAAVHNNMYSQGNNRNMNTLPQNNMYLQNNNINTNMNMAQQNGSFTSSNNVNMNSKCFLNLEDIEDAMNQKNHQATGYEMQPMNMQLAYEASYAPSGNKTQYSNDIMMPYNQEFYATSSHFTDTGRSGLIGEYTNMESNYGNFVIIKSVISTETREELDLI
jgi:hypothetical protein